jgi:hypothetical protein
VQEAFAVALRKWPADGLPLNPGGWITTTALDRAIAIGEVRGPAAEEVSVLVVVHVEVNKPTVLGDGDGYPGRSRTVSGVEA